MPIQPSENLNSTAYAIAADIASFHMRPINRLATPADVLAANALAEAELVHKLYKAIMHGNEKPTQPRAGGVGLSS